MPKFDMGRTKDLLWPDLGGSGAAVGGHYLARGIDSVQGWTKPFKRMQDYAALAMLGGSWGLYCANKAPNFAEAWFGSNTTLLMEGLADKIFGAPEEAFAGLRTRRRVDTQFAGDRRPPDQSPPTPAFAGVAVGAGYE